MISSRHVREHCYTVYEGKRQRYMPRQMSKIHEKAARACMPHDGFASFTQVFQVLYRYLLRHHDDLYRSLSVLCGVSWLNTGVCRCCIGFTCCLRVVLALHGCVVIMCVIHRVHIGFIYVIVIIAQAAQMYLGVCKLSIKFMNCYVNVFTHFLCAPHNLRRRYVCCYRYHMDVLHKSYMCS